MKNLLSILIIVTMLTACNFPLLHKAALPLEAKQPKMPLLTKKENTMLETNLPEHITQVKSIELKLKGSENLTDISKVNFYYGENQKSAKLIGTETVQKKSVRIESLNLTTSKTKKLFVSAHIIDTPNLLNKIEIEYLIIQNEKNEIFRFTLSDENIPQRMGLTLREKHQDNIDTYRIPGLATTNNGTLIAVYDNRYDSSVDLQGNINVGMSRSTDGGQTWEPMKVIMDMGTYGNKPEDENGIGDPSVLVDIATNTIWVAALWQHGDKGKRVWWASKPGLAPEETGQMMLVKSEDDGKTWSAPINITKQVKNPEWYLFFDGPGKGITMEDGTLLFPAQYKDKNQVPHSTIMYSKDHGKTWKSGVGAKTHTTEAQVIELDNGDIMLNMRDDRNRSQGDISDGKYARAVAVSSDFGKTWREHPTSRKALRASNCMASIIKIRKEGGKSLYFFSNPDSQKKRNHTTIKTSDDEANSWNQYKPVVLYENDTYGYSCMSPIEEGKYIGILYEGAGDLYFQKVPVSDCLNKK